MDEKSRLHIRYVGIIALIITLGSVVLAGFNDQAFIGQFSFASTITSIILSVVAIWMSITGERGTNEIRCKITEVVERLTNTTSNAEAVNTEFISTIEKQEKLYNSIEQRLCAIIDGVESVKQEVTSSREDVANLFKNQSNKKQKKLTDEEKDKVFNVFFEGNYNKAQLVILYSLSIMQDCGIEKSSDIDKFLERLNESGYKVDNRVSDVIIGMYFVFRALGYYESNYVNKFYKLINDMMKNINEILNQQTNNN